MAKKCTAGDAELLLGQCRGIRYTKPWVSESGPGPETRFLLIIPWYTISQALEVTSHFQGCFLSKGTKVLTTIIDASCKVNETEIACGCEISHAATGSQSGFLGSLRLPANMISVSVVGMCKIPYFNRSILLFWITSDFSIRGFTTHGYKYFRLKRIFNSLKHLKITCKLRKKDQ